jgi:hypothetical protein
MEENLINGVTAHVHGSEELILLKWKNSNVSTDSTSSLSESGLDLYRN